jgi:hypothetical protein
MEAKIEQRGSGDNRSPLPHSKPVNPSTQKESQKEGPKKIEIAEHFRRLVSLQSGQELIGLLALIKQ